MCVVHREHHRAQIARRVDELRDGLRSRDPPAQEERGARLGRDQVDLLDHPEDRADRGHHREVAKAAVEHVEEHVAAETIGRARVGRRRHHRRHRHVAGQPVRDHPRAEIVVGEDSERAVAEVYDRGRHLGGGHQLGRLADRRVRPAYDRVRAQERSDRLERRIDAGLGGDGRARMGRGGPEAEQRPGHEPEPGRARQRLLRDLGRDPVADRVLAGSGLEAGRQAGQHRRVAEQLAFPEQVEHAAVEHDLDRARAHHPQVLDRLGALREDRRAGAMELGLGGRDDALELGAVERVKRRVLLEEAGDLGRRDGAHGLSRRLRVRRARHPAARPP